MGIDYTFAEIASSRVIYILPFSPHHTYFLLFVGRQFPLLYYLCIFIVTLSQGDLLGACAPPKLSFSVCFAFKSSIKLLSGFVSCRQVLYMYV